MSKYYRLESGDILCEQVNKFINTLEKEKEETKEKYPWLEQDDERKNMTDKDILDKYIDLDKGQNRQNFRQNNNNWRRNRSFSRERNYNSNRGYE